MVKASANATLGYWKSRLIYDFKPFIGHRMMRFYRDFIDAESLCFDLGAHTGNRCAAWLRLGARVVAVEPQPAFVQLMERKFGDMRGFRLMPAAIGDRRGSARLHVSSSHPTISTLSRQWIETLQSFDPALEWDRNYEVEVTTLDAMIERFGEPDFCKIDVEGFEEQVLQGLSRPIRALSFEFFPSVPQQAAHCIQRLNELGDYRYNWALTESFSLREPDWLSPEAMVHRLQKFTGKKSGDIYAILVP